MQEQGSGLKQYYGKFADEWQKNNNKDPYEPVNVIEFLSHVTPLLVAEHEDRINQLYEMINGLREILKKHIKLLGGNVEP
jgi:hypothetical protein